MGTKMPLGRFLSVDPLAPDFPWYTPYQYAGNTPVQAIDLEGAEELKINSPYYTQQLANAILVCETEQEVKELVVAFYQAYNSDRMPNPKPETGLPDAYIREKFGEMAMVLRPLEDRIVVTGTALFQEETYTGEFADRTLLVYDFEAPFEENKNRLKLWGMPMQNRDAPGRETGARDDVEGMYRPIDITWLMRIASFLKPGAVNKFKRRAPGAARTQETIDGISKATDPIQEDILPKKKLKIDTFYAIEGINSKGKYFGKVKHSSEFTKAVNLLKESGATVHKVKIIRKDSSYENILTPEVVNKLDFVKE